jgi:hypothetical protein
MMRAFTAFTHPRRILMVRALADGPAALHVLAERCAISPLAAGRHADKLLRRGVISETPDGAYQLVEPPDTLLRDLLAIALSGA